MTSSLGLLESPSDESSLEFLVRGTRQETHICRYRPLVPLEVSLLSAGQRGTYLAITRTGPVSACFYRHLGHRHDSDCEILVENQTPSHSTLYLGNCILLSNGNRSLTRPDLHAIQKLGSVYRWPTSLDVQRAPRILHRRRIPFLVLCHHVQPI